MNQKLTISVSVVFSCFLSVTFVSVLDSAFEIQDESLKLTLVAMLSAINALSLNKFLVRRAKV
jgi:flagellar biosynthesis protein FliQ